MAEVERGDDSQGTRETRSGFVQLPNAFVRDPSISLREKAVVALLQSYAWGSDKCFIGQDLMAAQLGCTPRTVYSILFALAEKGVVKAEQRGRGRPNVYTLHLEKWWQLDRKETSDQAEAGSDDRKKTSDLDRKKTSDQEAMIGKNAYCEMPTNPVAMRAEAAPNNTQLSYKTQSEEDSDTRAREDYILTASRELAKRKREKIVKKRSGGYAIPHSWRDAFGKAFDENVPLELLLETIRVEPELIGPYDAYRKAKRRKNVYRDDPAARQPGFVSGWLKLQEEAEDNGDVG